jgi:CheY-like chemotaxis protein
MGDATQLQQVVLNLARNAIQATREGGDVAIAVELRELREPRRLSHGQLHSGSYVTVSVSDTGHGMSEDVQRRLFEPFFTTRPDGNGFGLATLREIVQEHGGAIDVSSRKGAGSRFEVWLPRVEAEPFLASDAAHLNDMPFGTGQTVLLVADGSERLPANEELLAAIGYEPVGFSRLQDALATCRKTPERFDVLLAGPVAAAASPLDLAATLQKIVPHRPVVLAVASVHDVDVEGMIAAGVAEIIGWPLHTKEIAVTLNRLLDHNGHATAWHRRQDEIVTG